MSTPKAESVCERRSWLERRAGGGRPSSGPATHHCGGSCAGVGRLRGDARRLAVRALVLDPPAVPPEAADVCEALLTAAAARRAVAPQAQVRVARCGEEQLGRRLALPS
eukprot:scaffold86572_cov36-Phaeocystis_antarctica.AAC.1